MCYISKKKQNADTGYNLDEPWKEYAQWKKPATTDLRLCGSIYVKYHKQANLYRIYLDIPVSRYNLLMGTGFLFEAMKIF